jgi:hypothetical protein
MSKENLNAKIAEITAIRDEDVKKPNMPVGEAVQEAENLVAWCQEDKAALTAAGLDWLLVEDLPVRAGACRYAQSIWARESKSREAAEKQWKAQSPAAFDLRDELVHHFLFAFRNHPDLVAKTQIIREGSSNADMLQDLSDLSVLGKDNQELLKAVGMDVKLLTTAATMADELSALLALANGTNGGDASAKATRDKAFSYMKKVVDEIRNTGQYVFWRDEERRKGYVSQYLKRTRDRLKNNKPKDDTTEE